MAASPPLPPRPLPEQSPPRFLSFFVSPRPVDSSSFILALLNIYGLLIIVGGLTALVFQIRGDFVEKVGNPLPVWRLNIADAIVLALGIVVCVLALMVVLGNLLMAVDSNLWRMGLYALCWQVGLLAIILTAMWRLPLLFEFRLNPVRLGFGQTLKSAITQFFAAMLLLALVALLWRSILKFLQSNGFGYFLQEQELVRLFNQDLPLGLIILMLLTAIIIAPITEELLFRGLIYRFLKSRLSARMAMVISSVAFGAMHGNMLAFIPLTFLAMILTRSYERTGNLKVPILIHAFFNANTLGILILKVYFPEAANLLQ